MRSRFSSPVSRLSTAENWPVTPMRARTPSGSVRTSRPPTSTSPESGVSIVVSMVTQPRPESELTGLVYSLTPKPKDTDVPLLQRPMSLAIIVIVLIVGLNLVFL